MKLKNLLKQLEGFDPETEIYSRSNENNNGEIYLNSIVHVIETYAILNESGYGGLIPNFTIASIHNPVKVLTI